ncbi:trans-sulfuration enzyme family protein [Pseudalkalibacillus caeni]|uniref:homocysteine desulfhydrase n=1 Tax=Exobacillus caeni TaxID=2574798 RepID=A0A5R9EW55_9BACL|nr:aminotransferase class I/II-fold pyridoxal phosphate-dependent enzyme [Pseudalkalibacillus caeni]TLS35277.1 aminotransferase class I/II-fold pyridoxal phosphate-dependent enzyme [Pseudalkalibacillus caeni]
MDFNFDTKTVHFQKKKSGQPATKATPIYQTSAFTFEDIEDLENFYKGKNDYLYTRVGNPNTDDLGEGVAQLEGAPKGLSTSSGISAIMAGILSAVKSGDHIVACDDLYGGTYTLLSEELPDFGIEVSFVDFTDKQAIRNTVKPNTKLLYTESVTNPLLRVEDIDSIVELAKEMDLYTMVDNTFATPYLVQPYLQGVDLIVHSATKYIGGHSDVTAGVLAGKENLVAKAKAKVINLGSNLGPFDGWLACRGLKTLSVRMERHVKNAALLAASLRETEGIKKVYYPEFVSEKGNGAIVTIELEEQVPVENFVKSLDWVKFVATLAGVDTSVSYPIATSHRSIPEETRQRLGINKQLLRVSVGIEDSKDIVEAFKNAVKKSLS